MRGFLQVLQERVATFVKELRAGAGGASASEAAPPAKKTNVLDQQPVSTQELP